MDSLKGSSAIMAKINQDMNVQEISAVMREFGKQMGIAEIKGDLVNDAIEISEDPNANADAENLYNGILSEIGLEYSAGNPAVPTRKIP